MESIFSGPRPAFMPFFDTHVAITGERKGGARVAGTFRAGIIDSGFDDPLTDSTMSTRFELAVQILRRGPEAWNYPSPPQLGDKVMLESGKVYSVCEVAEFDGDIYELKVREC